MLDLNARFYDPQVGRLFTPDPAEQFSNPYLAMGNNPVNGIDPNGEWFIWDSWITGFVHGFFSSGSNRFDNAWDQANLSASNDAKIIGGMFATDENKHGFFQKTWEIVSRFTYQLPQTLGGYVGAQSANTAQRVNWVRHKYGATVVQTKGQWGGITLGNYIIGDADIEPNANNPLFQHEYGHYIQRQEMGWAYIPRVGIPSFESARGNGNHKLFITEQDANRRAFLYFNDKVADFKNDNDLSSPNYNENLGWDFRRNRFQQGIGVVRTYAYGSGFINLHYVDYTNSTHVNSLNSIKLKARCYDYD